MSPALSFAVVLPTLLVAHHVGDYWVQTDTQACTKGLPGWTGRVACAWHVATYTATCYVALVAVDWMLGLHLSPAGIVLGLAVSAVTHYVADRRTPLARLAGWLGKAPFWRLGTPREGRDDGPCLGTGAHFLDQSWHQLWLWVAAVLMAVIR